MEQEWAWGNPAHWSVEDVCLFLQESTGFSQYGQCFRENNVSGKRMLRIRSSNLVEMGICIWDDQKKIFSAIKKAQEKEAMMSMPIPPPPPKIRGKKKKVSKTKSRPAYDNVDDETGGLDEYFVEDTGGSPRETLLEEEGPNTDQTEKSLMAEERPLAERPASVTEVKPAAVQENAESSHLREKELAPALVVEENVASQPPATKTTEIAESENVKESAPDGNAVSVTETSSGNKEEVEEEEERKRREAAALKIQTRARGMAGRSRFQAVKVGEIEPLPKEKRTSNLPTMTIQTMEFNETQNTASVKIQARARGMAGRRRFQQIKNGEIEPLPKEKRKADLEKVE